MVPNQGNSPARDDDRPAAQPSPLAKTFWKKFLEKMAITVRLFGKEVYRKKLQWFDLNRADYRLGKKAYDVGSSLPDQRRVIDRLTTIQNRIEVLGQPLKSELSFKVVAKGAGRAMKIQILKFKQNHLFRKLGGQLRKIPDTEASLTTEAEQSKSVSARIDVVNSDMHTLAAQTYGWARKPLMMGLLVLILILAFVGVAYEQGAGREAQNTPAINLISKADLESITGLTLREPARREVKDILSKTSLEDVEEASSCLFPSNLPESEPFKGIELTVRYLREKDEDRAETYIRAAIKKGTGSPVDTISDIGYGSFCVTNDCLYVFKPTSRGCTLLQVAMTGANSLNSEHKQTLRWEDMVEREKNIALKILGPAATRVASYESRHPAEEDAVPSLPETGIPLLDRMAKQAREMEIASRADSKRIVEASGGKKILCPKCAGSKKMVRREYDSTSWNPHKWGTLAHSLFENNRNKVTLVNCDKCGGTGVIDK